MPDKFPFQVYGIVGSSLCVATEDGQKVFDQIAPILRHGHSVELSFLNVEIMTTAFLNVAIGQLYGQFDEKTIESLLIVQDLLPEDESLLAWVKESAKRYFEDEDPDLYDRYAHEELGIERGDVVY